MQLSLQERHTMSKIALTPNASGTGVFTISSPATNTNRTLTLPDITGTLVSTDASGNVGIGTSSPLAKTNIVSAGAALGGTSHLALGASTTGFENTYLRIDNSGNSNFCIDQIFGGVSYNRMFIERTTGNVGIGTTSITQPSAGATTLKIKGTDNDKAGAIFLESANASVLAYIYPDNSNGLSINTSTSHPIVFRTAALERMRIDSTGAVTMPYQPAFSVNNAPTPQANIAINTVVTITWAGERFDQNADFDLGANSFTAPVTGKYQFNVVIRLDNVDIDADYYIISIVTSNVEYKYIFDPVFVSDPAYFTVNLSVLADLDASDTAYTTIYQGGGAAQTDITGDASYTYFTGYLVA
jgi:hypothetical protein